MKMEVVGVQKLISNGELKVVDPFVTDRAFEEFCRKHGSALNMALIEPRTRKWLIREYGVADLDGEKTLPRAQKHALIVRACKCGRKIAGNVYFRHIRHCRSATALSIQCRDLKVMAHKIPTLPCNLFDISKKALSSQPPCRL